MCVTCVPVSLSNPFLCCNRTKALVLELLAAVCLVRGGHDIILSAFDNFTEVKYVFKDIYFTVLTLTVVCSGIPLS